MNARSCGTLLLAEDVGTKQFQELAPRLGDALLLPLTDAGRLDLAQRGDSKRPAECFDDFFVAVLAHGAMVGLPNSKVNRHTLRMTY